MPEQMDQIEKLESKQRSLLEKVSKDDHINWLSMPSTKAMFIQFEIDQEQLRELWAAGQYGDVENLKAQGQAYYILDLEQKIKEMLSDD